MDGGRVDRIPVVVMTGIWRSSNSGGRGKTSLAFARAYRTSEIPIKVSLVHFLGQIRRRCGFFFINLSWELSLHGEVGEARMIAKGVGGRVEKEEEGGAVFKGSRQSEGQDFL